MVENNLQYLDELDNYEVASGYSDVRGWTVKDSEKRSIGTVEKLIVNKKTKRVVYLDVEVDQSLIDDEQETLDASSDGVHKFTNKEGENHIIIPIGLADFDEDNKEVYCNSIGYSIFKSTKRYKKGSTVEPGYELIVYKHYLPDNSEGEITTIDDEFYNRKGFRRRGE